jgi:microcystin-dependent protein
MADTAAVATADAGERFDEREVLGTGAELQVPSSAALPVGTILAFAGRFPDDLRDKGWYPCWGQSVPTTGEFGELFAAIGYAFGQKAHDHFSFPDLRGWFQRATSGGAAVRDDRDPDWESRRAPLSIFGRAKERAALDAVGTTQLYGTATPREHFRTTAGSLHITKDTDDKGCGDRPAKYNDDTQTFHATGGDLESRPVNKYVTFLIKVRSTIGSSAVIVPVGALVPFAGQMGTGAPPFPTWRVCHGGAVVKFDAGELFDALGFIHGGGDNQFILPDYRGWFQRGVSGDSPADPDPDAEKRTWAHPQGQSGQQGNQGNSVGSAQPWATGAPTQPFSTSLKHLPTSEEAKRVPGTLWNLLRKGGKRVIELSSDGGDRESRPPNVSVDWYVLSRLDSPYPEFPIGGVAAMGCTLEPNKWWLPCAGRTLPVADYGALYKAIGNTYGGDDKTFMLPDYRGRFLRGASYDSGVDPDVSKRAAKGSVPPGGVGTFQDWATARPLRPFQGDVPNYPGGDLGAHGVTNSGNARNNGSLTFDTCTAGGDGETRPRNVYLNFYIRAV